MKMYATKAEAKRELDASKDRTFYFDGSLKMSDMKKMLLYRMGFGEAETNVILAALVLAGAKFEV
jgi:hypothetical protein